MVKYNFTWNVVKSNVFIEILIVYSGNFNRWERIDRARTCLRARLVFSSFGIKWKRNNINKIRNLSQWTPTWPSRGNPELVMCLWVILFTFVVQISTDKTYGNGSLWGPGRQQRRPRGRGRDRRRRFFFRRQIFRFRNLGWSGKLVMKDFSLHQGIKNKRNTAWIKTRFLKLK